MSEYMISYGLTLIAFLITVGAQLFISSAYSNYKKIKNNKNITGKEAARKILDKNGLNNIKIEKVSGTLSDHYDPVEKTVRLSSDIYEGTSIASVAVACHECGHAIQDKIGYGPLKLRHNLIPIVNFSSYAGYIAIVVGLLFSLISMVWLGIIAEIVILLFQLVTLPVEFNASSRALRELQNEDILNKVEMSGARTVLTAAALTYVASVASTILEILRLILLFTRREDD